MGDQQSCYTVFHDEDGIKEHKECSENNCDVDMCATNEDDEKGTKDVTPVCEDRKQR